MRQFVVILSLVLLEPASSSASPVSDPAPQETIARPSSKARYPRKGFNFLYEEHTGTKIDTERDVYTKDLVSNPDTTISLVLSKDEMDRVYAKMIAIGFFDMSEPHPAYPIENRMTIIRPHTLIRLEATAGSRTRRLSWDTGRGMTHRTAAWAGLQELTRLIQQILENRPESLALPEPNGGYM